MPDPLRRISLDDRRRDAWEGLVRAHPSCGFMQSLTWADFQRRQGVAVYPRAWARGGRLEGGAIFHAARSLDGPGLLVTPAGPVVPWSDPERARPLFAALAAEARRLMHATGSLFWRIEPRLPAPLPEYVRGFVRAPVDLDPYETREVDLAGGPDAVLARMDPKGRYNVRLAGRHGVSVAIVSDPAAARPFHALLAETAARQGFAAEPLAYVLELAAVLFPAGLAAAFFASYRGEVLAAAIATFYGPRATYLYGASRRAHRPVMAGYAVQAAILAEAIRRGCTTYDLYGVDARGRPGHAYHRLSQFKRRFGGEVRVYAGAHDRYDYDLVADAMIPFFRHLAAGEEGAVSAVGLILHTLMLLAAGLGLFGLGHGLLILLLRPARLREELFEKDNPAMGVAVAGYHLGLVLSFGSLLGGESRGWVTDLVQILGYGAVAVALFAACGGLARAVAIGRLGLVRELTQDRNLGLGFVLAGYLGASGLILHGLLAGEGGTWLTIPVFFALGQATLLAVGLVYGRIVGYALREELARDNAAAGLAYGGCLLGMGLVLGQVVAGEFVSWRASLLGFAAYALVGLAALPAIRWLADLILAPGVRLSREIAAAEGAAPNLVAGTLEATSYVAAGLLVAWSLS